MTAAGPLPHSSATRRDISTRIIFRIPAAPDEAEAYGQLVLGIAKASTPDDWQRYQRSIEEIAVTVSKQEEAQVSRFQRIVASIKEKLKETLGVPDAIRTTSGLADRMARMIESEEGLRGAAEMMVRSAAM